MAVMLIKIIIGAIIFVAAMEGVWTLLVLFHKFRKKGYH